MGTFEVWRIISRLTQEMAYYGLSTSLIPNGTNPAGQVALSVPGPGGYTLTIQAQQTKLLDSGQYINMGSNVLCRYSPATGEWWVEGWACASDPSG